MLEKQLIIKIICSVDQYEDEENLVQYLEHSLKDVIDGEINSITINDDE